MNILFSIPDRIQFKFSVSESSLPYLFTDSFRNYHRDFSFIKCFVRNLLSGKQVKKNGTFWFRVSDILFTYRSQDLSFLVEINPIKKTSHALHNSGYYSIQKSIDFNTNFIDPFYLKGKSTEDIEAIIYDSIEQAKNQAISILKVFLSKGFGVNTDIIELGCKFNLIELACDIKHENPCEFIDQIEKPLIANFGDTTKYGTAKNHSVTVFKKKRKSDIQEQGRETRIIYQKSSNILRYERVFHKKEISPENVLLFNSQDFKSFFRSFKQVVLEELKFLVDEIDFSGNENTENFKLTLTIWLWKKLSAIKIPSEKFYLIEIAIKTEQLDTSLLCDPYLKAKLIESGAFVPAMESADMKRPRYLRISKNLFRTETNH